MLTDKLPSYIVIEGPIGVGKTSLARRLAEDSSSELLLERAEENPFLERFYQNPTQAGLPTQLYFLFQRIKQLEHFRQDDLFRTGMVADFMFEKDRLFAEAILADDELHLYDQVSANLDVTFRSPDLVIYLQAPLEVLLARIQKRQRKAESHLDSGYLQRLIDGYTEFFYHYIDAPLLIVNASEIDLVGNAKDYQALVEQIAQAKSGRHYFNPLPIAL